MKKMATGVMCHDVVNGAIVNDAVATTVNPDT
jgi:hypothetical protein